jgi:hypothetical protein
VTQREALAADTMKLRELWDGSDEGMNLAY